MWLQVVSPTISSPVCQEQLIEAGKLVDRSVESCVQACLSATEDGELLKQVSLTLSALFFSGLTRQLNRYITSLAQKTTNYHLAD